MIISITERKVLMMLLGKNHNSNIYKNKPRSCFRSVKSTAKQYHSFRIAMTPIFYDGWRQRRPRYKVLVKVQNSWWTKNVASWRNPLSLHRDIARKYW